MKTFTLRSGLVTWFGLVAGLLGWVGAAQGVSFSVSPASTSNTYAGQITLQIGGLATGETVVVQKCLDANTNGVPDAADWVVQSLRLTDGRANTIGGVTNINVPYDANPTNGAVTARLSLLTSGIGQKFIGKYLYRLTSPTNHFAATNCAFTVTNTPYAQYFTGKVQCGGTNVPYAGILVFPPPSDDGGGPVAAAVADGSGTYTVKVAPGDYQLWAFKTNYVYDVGAAPVITLSASTPITNNLNLIPATRSISGAYVDATNTSTGLPGILVAPSSQAGLVAIGFTGTNGTFAAPVTAGTWEMGGDDQELTTYGYLRLRHQPSVDTTTGSVSGMTIAVPRGTALFYGTVKDDQNHPLAGFRLYANDDGELYDVDGTTDANGNYAIAVVAGAWHVQPDEDNPGYVFSGIHTNVTDGQAVRVDFTGTMAVTISGTISGGGAPLSGAHVDAGIVTFSGNDNWDAQWVAGKDANSDGTYTLTVPPGTNYTVRAHGPNGWLEQYYNLASDVHAATPVAALTNAPATNINFNLQQGAQISGRVLGSGTALEDADIQAHYVVTNQSGDRQREYAASTRSDSNGDYTLYVQPGLNYDVRARGPDGSSWVEQYFSNVVNDSDATLVMPLTNAPATNIDFDLQAGALISGRVRGGGAPLEGISVEVGTITFQEGGEWDWDQKYYGADTDANGDYTRVVPAGTNYYVRVNPPGGSPWLGEFYIDAADAPSATVVTALTNAPATNIDFNLQQGVTVSGRVLGDGNPLAGINVSVGMITFFGGGGWTWEQIYWGNTDSNGYYSAAVPPGTNYYARANPPDGAPWLEQFYSNATDASSATVITALNNVPATNIDFELLLGMNIQGWVTDASNNPVSTTVEIGQWDGTNWWSTWWAWSGNNGAGHYSCAVAAGSSYCVRITDANYHEVYFNNALTAASANVIGGPPGTIINNVNFKLYDPSADSDGDGIPDYVEGYVTGTDTFNANDRLRCTGLRLNGGRPTLSWGAMSNREYTVERSTNLLNSAGWTNITPQPVVAVSTNGSLIDSNAPPRSHYRVLISY